MGSRAKAGERSIEYKGFELVEGKTRWRVYNPDGMLMLMSTQSEEEARKVVDEMVGSIEVGE
jgi:hypothetical protein